jgi:DNA polymerase-3 subunit epsilon
VKRANEEELAAHASYLGDLDKAVKGSCLWRTLEAPPAGDAT